MAINTTALFTKLGRIGKVFYSAHALQAGIDTSLDSLLDQYDGTYRNVTAGVIQSVSDQKASVTSSLYPLVSLAQDTLTKAVFDDQPSQAYSIDACIAELIRQMEGTDTVKRCTVSVTPTALTGNVGTGRISTTSTRGDGLPQENIMAETAEVKCILDSYATNGATEGVETFAYQGGTPNAGQLDYNFPGYSGAQAVITAISPDTTGDGGTQILNGDFEDYAVANTPDDWTITVGTAGTHLLQDTSVFYTGLSSLKIPGSATLLNISQALTNRIPLAAYAVNLWVRVDSTPAAGVMTIDLYSATAGAVVADDAGNNNTTTIALTGLTGATWTGAGTVFRLPKNPPTDTVLRVRMTTGLTVGRYANIDRLCIAPMSVPYTGGPGICIFSGATPFVNGDGWSLAVANNQAGSTYGSTFQTLFDRLFNMREMGAVLPSTTGSPTQADTLITS